MIIYKITNLINNKIYIGLTTLSLNKRWTSHKAECKRNNKKYLYNAMRKYGIESFKIEEIDNTDDIVKLGELERYYIKFYDSRNPEKDTILLQEVKEINLTQIQEQLYLLKK